VDEDMYPEHYRKSEYVKGNNYSTPDPFQVHHFLIRNSGIPVGPGGFFFWN